MASDIDKIVRSLLDDNDIIEPRQQLEIFHNQAKEAQARLIQLSVQYRMTTGDEKKKLGDLITAAAPGLEQIKRDFTRMKANVDNLDRQERLKAQREKVDQEQDDCATQSSEILRGEVANDVLLDDVE